MEEGLLLGQPGPVAAPGAAVLLIPGPDSAAGDEYAAQAIRAREAIDTILEAQGPMLALGKGDSAGPINPSLRLSVSLSVRLIRTADGEVLYAFFPEHRGETRTYTAWAANNAQPLREELGRASEKLSRQIVDQVFGPQMLPEEEKETP